MSHEIPYKIYLSENEMPQAWYNVRADMTPPLSPLINPQTHQPMTAEELGKVFCDELVKQELNEKDRYIPIPDEILQFYRMYRPAPLTRDRYQQFVCTAIRSHYKSGGLSACPRRWWSPAGW